MINNNTTNFKILDCTIRDGGYVNNWSFDKKLVREVYRALSKSGVDYIEIGYKGTEKYFSKEKYGLWMFSPDDAIREVVGNISGSKIALMADYGKIDLDDFCDAKDSIIELVRIAVHRDNLKGAITLLEQIKKKGYEVSLNAMGYTNYSESEKKEFIKLIKSSDIDYVYIADSYGSLFPYQIKKVFEPLLEKTHSKIGFHPHNNLQMAFANTLEAIKCGVHMVDTTIYGMGRGAGNLPTEILICFLENEGKNKYNSIPILNIIDRYFTKMQNDNPWGYQLPYMLSGIFQCHPNYPKTLIDYKEYTVEDIWKAMDCIKKINPVGFSKSILERLITEGVIGGYKQNLYKELIPSINEDQFRKMTSFNEVPYINRHKDRDFLILANGHSLKENKTKIEQFINKYNPIVVAANYLGGLLQPHYHAFTNKRRFVEYIDTASPESKLLLGQYIPDEMIREYSNRDYEKIYYIDTLNSDFEIINGVITTNCRTVSVLLLGVAIVMGARRIFSAGMDGYIGFEINDLHFYNEKDEQEDKELILERHRWCQRFLEQIDNYLIKNNKEGIHILTPTTYKAFYKGIENYI